MLREYQEGSHVHLIKVCFTKFTDFQMTSFTMGFLNATIWIVLNYILRPTMEIYASICIICMYLM